MDGLDHQSQQSQPPALLEKLRNPEIYPPTVQSIEVIETLLSWVLLTGTYAYKIKKPVVFDYVDFSSLAARKYFCKEELRCNQAFAPELYIAVVPIIDTGSGEVKIGASSELDGSDVIEFAVQMVQFEQSAQVDRRLDAGLLGPEEMVQFGHTLATQHKKLPVIHSPVDSAKPMRNNFDALRKVASIEPLREKLNDLEATAEQELTALEGTLARRQRGGFYRECHGDLHLQNLVVTDLGIRAFDCLEFDAALRTIDVCSDAAFLFMDCCVRGREDLGYAFIDGYLNVSGDYDGALLLPLYAFYRSMVRAKVAALQLEQSYSQTQLDVLNSYVEWAYRNQRRAVGQLIITCGVSGSGKSYWAAQLLTKLPAIRLRSDVLRKYRNAVAIDSNSKSPLDDGIYSPDQTESVYKQLALLADRLLRRGENVIVDCANLKSSQRRLFYTTAERVGARCVLLHLTASRSALERRIDQRRADGTDASEADLDILDWQFNHQEPPAEWEPSIKVCTEQSSVGSILESIKSFRA